MTIDLRQVPLFQALDNSQVDWLLAMSERVKLQPSSILMREGDIGDAMYIILSGEVEVLRQVGDKDVLLAVRGNDEIMGEMSLLEDRPRSATVRVSRESELLKISKKTLDELIARNPSTALVLLRTVSNRLRNTELMLRQQAKMAALGTLSAGLTHELNNPAAAARRGASVLRQAVMDYQRLSSELYSLSLSSDQKAALTQATNQMTQLIGSAADASSGFASVLSSSDRVNELEQWLDDHQIEEAWNLAPTLAACGWFTDQLQPILEHFVLDEWTAVIGWLAQGCLISNLLQEIHHSTERISAIVNAVKSYSYLDQAPVQQVNIHKGLDDTLVILTHKLKQGVRLRKDYDPKLPMIEGYGSELNQVWTNLIDNAIDAMDGIGELTIKTRIEQNAADHAQVAIIEISDTGPGIPSETKQHIFEPFFTTKELGKGTGLGLHISHNIIQKHRGKIEVESQPGHTCFQVTLPVRLASQTTA